MFGSMRLSPMYALVVLLLTIVAATQLPACSAFGGREATTPTKKPVTLLSGFLGTGKTTTLKHLLENQAGLRIGVVVNDMASINIDEKLLAAGANNNNDNKYEKMLTLENGCVCCSLKDELTTSVENLLETNPKLDCVVVELSGIADPGEITSGWKSPTATVTRVVTLVDVPSFGSDYMTWDTAGDRPGWLETPEEKKQNKDDDDGCCTTGQNPVSHLLVQQVENADLVLLNKMDLANADQLEVATKITGALNPRAEVERIEFGRVPPERVLGLATQQQRVPVVAEEEDEEKTTTKRRKKKRSLGFSKLRKNVLGGAGGSSNNDSSSPAASVACTGEEATPEGGECCAKPECNTAADASDDGGASSSSSCGTSLGISSFVYEARRPFTERIMKLLAEWPIPLKETLDPIDIAENGDGAYGRESLPEGSEKHPFVGVLRSKGFCWFTPTKWAANAWRHDTVMVWGHAGRQFSVHASGKWIAALSDAERNRIVSPKEWERIKRDDYGSSEFGDRRQELVFIGTNLQERAIRKALDECLVNDDEWDVYKRMAKRHESYVQ